MVYYSPYCSLQGVETSQVIYYATSWLPASFTTQSRQKYQFFQHKHNWSLKNCWVQSNQPLLIQFTETHAGQVFYTLRKCCSFSSNTFVLNTIFLLHKNRQNLVQFATSCNVYRGFAHEIYHILRGVDAAHFVYYADSKLSVSFTGLEKENLAKTHPKVYSTT